MSVENGYEGQYAISAQQNVSNTLQCEQRHNNKSYVSDTIKISITNSIQILFGFNVH
jgi:hypothetical protein